MNINNLHYLFTYSFYKYYYKRGKNDVIYYFRINNNGQRFNIDKITFLKSLQQKSYDELDIKRQLRTFYKYLRENNISLNYNSYSIVNDFMNKKRNFNINEDKNE